MKDVDFGRPGGVLVIADYSYLAEHSAVARDTEELILARLLNERDPEPMVVEHRVWCVAAGKPT